MIGIGNSLRYTYAVDNLLVEDVTAPGTPLEITGMTAENTAPGSRDIVVSFTLPTLDTSDAPANVNKVELKRNDDVINTWTEGIADGQTLSFTDMNAPYWHSFIYSHRLQCAGCFSSGNGECPFRSRL